MEEPRPHTRANSAPLDEGEQIARLDSLSLDDGRRKEPRAEHPNDGRSARARSRGGYRERVARTAAPGMDGDSARELRKKMLLRGMRNLGGPPSRPGIEGAVEAVLDAPRRRRRGAALERAPALCRRGPRAAADRRRDRTRTCASGLDAGASSDAIRGSYLNLAKQFHPDRARRAGALVPAAGAADALRAAQGSVRAHRLAGRSRAVRRLAQGGVAGGDAQGRGEHRLEDGRRAPQEARLRPGAREAAARGGSRRQRQIAGGARLVPGERSEVVAAGEGRGGVADQPGAARARRDRPHLLRRRRALADEGPGIGRRRVPQGAGAGAEASRRRAGAAADRAAPRQADRRAPASSPGLLFGKRKS